MYLGLPRIALVVAVACASRAVDGAAQAPTDATPDAPRLSKRETEKLRRRIDYIPASSVTGALRGSGKVMGKTLQTAGDQQTNFQVVRRQESGLPEVHARWDDLMIIRTGAGALITGDSLIGSQYRAPGERRGGRFNKSYEIPLRAGDVIRIPAAVPHAVTVSGGEALEYLLIKQRRQELPIRWFESADDKHRAQ